MADTAHDFARLVPGFDFLQGLVKNAGSVLPNIGQWVAPTLDPEELEKRIEELRTVQFWLEQNARMLGATIQALEVQRMTLSTLKTMNVQVADLRESMRIKLPGEDAAEADAPAAATTARTWPMPGTGTPQDSPESGAGQSGSDDAPASRPKRARPAPASQAKAAAAPAGVVDPMQWWGALTHQFTQLAASAMKDAAADSAKQLAGNLVKQSFEAAEQTIKVGMAPARKAAELAGNVANKVARSAAKAKAERKAPLAGAKTPAKRAPARRR